MDEETKTQVIALQMEVNALRVALEYLLWRSAHQSEGEAQDEAAGHIRHLEDQFRQAARRRAG